MNQDDAKPADADEPGSSRMPLIVTLVALLTMGFLWFLSATTGAPGWHVGFLVSQVVIISIVIWQACDPFADAAQWIGTQMRIPGSVRGATLDAIASSMPELFTGIFFVIVAVMAGGGSREKLIEEAGDGYGAAIATCAGSAVYNMILIPAFCALVISFSRKKRPTIDVEPEVLGRDGLWFLGCEFVLIVFLFQDVMYWWMGAVLILMYCAYIGQLYRDARRYQRAMAAIQTHRDEIGDRPTPQAISQILDSERIHATPLLVDRIRDGLAGKDEEEEDDDDATAGALFGFIQIPLNKATCWLVILGSTLVAATACYWLVEVTKNTAVGLGDLIGQEVPVFFVAVILAAAASSVPDTFLAIGAARRGDDSGAVSNAFGSNIFDICICLSVPLIICSIMLGGEPVRLTQNGEPMAGLVDLRILLASLTVITLLIMWHQRQLTRAKALVLCGLYSLFIAYAVAGSFGFSIISWVNKLFAGQ